jgi:hypothetical protein
LARGLVTMTSDRHDSFSKTATEARPSIVTELWLFVRHNKKWWLGPIIVVLLAFGLLILLGSTAAAPFIYTLF